MELTITRYDPEPDAEVPTYVDVGFSVSLSDGTTVYSTTTVQLAGLPDTTPATVTAAAEAMVRPGLEILDAQVQEDED